MLNVIVGVLFNVSEIVLKLCSCQSLFCPVCIVLEEAKERNKFCFVCHGFAHSQRVIFTLSSWESPMPAKTNVRSQTWLCSHFGTAFLVYLLLLCGRDLNNTWRRCYCRLPFDRSQEFSWERCCLTILHVNSWSIEVLICF